MLGPPLSLLDEQVRLALVAAAEALAAAPGALYPLVYVGPLARADALNRAAAEAAAAFGIGCGTWTPHSAPRGPALLVCDSEEIPAALRELPDQVQLIAWGPSAAGDLPPGVRDAVGAPGNLVIEVDSGGLARESAWLGGTLERAAKEGRGALVVIAPRDSLHLHADHALLLLESAGVSARAASGPDDARTGEQALVAVWTASAAVGPEPLSRMAGDLHQAGRTLVLVTDTGSWETLRETDVWAAAAGPCSVVRVGPLVTDAAHAGLSWPQVTAIWIGAPDAADAEAILLPEGTTLLEGLGYLEVRGRAGRLVAWRPDALATVSVDARAAGAAVVSAEVCGAGDATDRESVLDVLDQVRRWPGLRLAVVWGGTDDVDTVVEEPVQRVGFHLSRLDDERAGAAPPALARAHPHLGLHAVAHRLVGLGLRDAALILLRDAERESRWGVDEEMLLGFLVSGADPQEAITRLRHAALRLATGTAAEDSWVRQTNATLNALLLMVRTRQVAADDAWVTVASWLQEAGTVWVASGRHAAVLFELAARAGRVAEARRFASMFRAMTGGDDPLCAALAPVLHAVVGVSA